MCELGDFFFFNISVGVIISVVVKWFINFIICGFGVKLKYDFKVFILF